MPWEIFGKSPGCIMSKRAKQNKQLSCNIFTAVLPVVTPHVSAKTLRVGTETNFMEASYSPLGSIPWLYTTLNFTDK